MSTSVGPANFFEATFAALDGLKQSHGSSLSTQHLHCGPFSLDLSSLGEAGPVLQKMMRAFALRQEGGSADLASWHLTYLSEDSPLGPPPKDWPFAVMDRDSFQRVHWQLPQIMTADETVGLWNLADVIKRRSLTWVAQESSLPSWEFAAPFRHHLHWLALQQEALLVHAASWAVDEIAVLLTGPGGSGKSTSSVAAVAMGREFYAEDLTWVDLSKEFVHVHALYNTVKVTADAQQRFGLVREFVDAHPHEEFDKTLVWLNQVAPPARPLQALYCLSGEFAAHTQIKSCSKGLAFRLLAPSTLFLMRTAQAQTLQSLRQLIDRLPCYHVTLGSDPCEVVQAIESHARTQVGSMNSHDQSSQPLEVKV